MVAVTALAGLVALIAALSQSSSWTSSSTVVAGSTGTVGRSPSDDAVLARGYVELLNGADYRRSLVAAGRIPAGFSATATTIAGSPLISIAGTASSAGAAQQGTDLLTAAFVSDITNGYARITAEQMTALRQRLGRITAVIAVLQRDRAGLAAGSDAATRATAQLAALETERATLADQLRTSATSAGTPNGVAVLRGASAPIEDAPSVARNLLLGLIGGLALGCALALFLGMREGELASESRIRERLGLPLLGVVPAGDAPARETGRRDALRGLAASLAPSRASPASLVVASPRHEEPSRLVARGLAEAWAEGGARVALVSGSGEAPPTGDPPANLRVIAPGGVSAPAPGAVLRARPSGGGHRSTAQVEDAELVVIEAAPLLRAPLGLGLNRDQPATALLVLDMARSTVDEAVVARDALVSAGAEVLGAVLVDPPASPLGRLPRPSRRP